MTQPPWGPAGPPNDEYTNPDGGQGTTFLRQFAGFVLGVTVGFVAVFASFFAAAPTPWLPIAVLGLCLAFGILVLAKKSPRTAGAGLLAGIAVGLITLAGACGGLLGLLVLGNR